MLRARARAIHHVTVRALAWREQTSESPHRCSRRSKWLHGADGADGADATRWELQESGDESGMDDVLHGADAKGWEVQESGD